jgi:mRNA-degrading endonuclease toxin of MazEF toxin-antitoxin module
MAANPSRCLPLVAAAPGAAPAGAVIRRGFVYRVARLFRDPRDTRPVVVMTGDTRNLDPRSATVVGIPLTTSLKGGVFRVRLKKGTGGVPETSEADCEQIDGGPGSLDPGEHCARFKPLPQGVTQ